MTQFWEAYPDGYLITIIRPPLNWFPSIRTLKAKQRKFRQVETTMTRWLDTVEAAFREKKRQPDRVIVIAFEDLLARPEATMRKICARIGLDFEEVLKTPTFNGDPVEGNTTFDPVMVGQVSRAPMEREVVISANDRDYIMRTCMPLYQRALDELIEPV
jgi:hypothetical protein